MSREQLKRELHAQMAVNAITKETAEDMLNHLPSVTPQPKRGNNELYKKIDNAIDDIENLEKIELSFSDLGGDVGSGWFVCIDEVLEIIKSI